MPTPVLSMAQRAENSSAILGEYMLKGWTLTDQICDQCRLTPLMREPAALARRQHRPQTHFCASCDGGPVRRPSREASTSSASSFMTAQSSAPPSPTTVHAPTLPSTPRRHMTPPGTPPRSQQLLQSPTSPPNSHIASTRGDPDAATDAISALMSRGYSLLSSTCPDPACKNVPLVGFPRRSNGKRDPRRECVSCGKRWVDEKDLAASGLRLYESASTSSGASTLSNPSVYDPAEHESPHTKSRRQLYAQGSATNQDGLRNETQPESPLSKARRELYAQGTAVMEERTRNQTAKKAEDAALVATAAAAAPQNGVARQEDAASFKTAISTHARRRFVADEHRPSVPDGKLRVVVVSSGSVASVKIPNIVAALGTDPNIEVQVVGTDASLYFFDKDAVEQGNKGVNVWRDVDEWSDWEKIGDPILHIELRRWADLVVIAPCSADMLAKLASGLCDNLPLSMLRALSSDTPVIICPAMNTHMYSHALTARHLSFVKEVLGYHVLGPQGAGMLACGDVGAGKMTEWTDIVRVIRGYADKTRKQPETERQATLSSILTPLQASEAINDVFYTPKQQSTVLPGTEGQSGKSVGTVLLSPLVLVYSTMCNALFLPALHFLSLGSRIVTGASAAPSAVMGYILTPFLVFLHLIFTISSVVLRVVQAQPKSTVEVAKEAPEHVALILVPGQLPWDVGTERYVESVRRAVLWAAEWEVKTLTVWDDQGLGIRLHQLVTDSLLDLPPSPPSSGSPSPRTSTDHGGQVAHIGDETISASVYVNTTNGPHRIEVHFLAPSASDTLARVTRQFAHDDVDPALIDQATLDAALKRDLRISTDPDLVIIHHLAPPGFFRGLLPRPAPELHGFPAWLLRISEIYTHPPRLPLYVPFLGALLQNSPLPIFRKLGGAFPSSEDTGVLSSDAWEGAQEAWEKLEQRKGK